MKKIYSQPTMNVGTMMPLGLIAGSWQVTTNGFAGDGNDGNSGLGGGLGSGDGSGNGGFGAKDRNFYSSYDDEW